jgi:hypothetical protein
MNNFTNLVHGPAEKIIQFLKMSVCELVSPVSLHSYQSKESFTAIPLKKKKHFI